jgi:TctA family transporter
MVGTLAGESALKGLAACGLGLLFGVIGTAPATGEERLTFDTLYLSSGLSIVIVGLGMFALPEIVDLLRRNQTISEGRLLGDGWLRGARDALRNKWLIVRCSGIGCLVGALPGLGGSVVDWIAYGHVIQTSKDRSEFGKGDIRGVIAPESANNAVQGGALFPTLFFGVPGSGTMAVLLAAFVLIGVEPGIGMMERHLDLTFIAIWSLALANVLGAGACFLLAPQIAKLTRIRYALIGPVMIVVIAFAAIQVTRDLADLVALFLIGVLGIWMKRFGWPRPAFLIGFVLSKSFESSVYQAIQVYGLSFLQRPIVLVILALTMLSVLVAIRMRRSLPVPSEAGEAVRLRRAPQIGFTLFLVAGVALALWDSLQVSWLGSIFPLAVSVATLALVAPVLAMQAVGAGPQGVFTDEEIGATAQRGCVHYLAWIAGLFPLVLVLGFPLAAGVFVFALVSTGLRGEVVRAAVLAAGSTAFLVIVARFLGLTYPNGQVQDILGLPF